MRSDSTEVNPHHSIKLARDKNQPYLVGRLCRVWAKFLCSVNSLTSMELQHGGACRKFGTKFKNHHTSVLLQSSKKVGGGWPTVTHQHFQCRMRRQIHLKTSMLPSTPDNWQLFSAVYSYTYLNKLNKLKPAPSFCLISTLQSSLGVLDCREQQGLRPSDSHSLSTEAAQGWGGVFSNEDTCSPWTWFSFTVITTNVAL